MNKLTLRAYGKINLGLDALRKRPDGYHEVAMIMQNVEIYDELTLTKKDEPGIELTVEAETGEIPTDRRNLVWRAAEGLIGEFGIDCGVQISLKKRIPVAAGMAGGSSDCAAALVGMNRLFELKLTREELMERGVKLGADVPYCILGGTALAEGIGERLTALTPMPQCSLVVAKPGISISTPFVYQRLRVDELDSHPDILGMRQAIESGSLDGIISRLGNVLETAAIPAFPVVGELKKALAKRGAEGVLMSGSGPTVFGIFRSDEAAEDAAKRLSETGLAQQIFVTHPCTPDTLS
jgi:4-diphosphocytidyl-2-C-methyl-D-erythritol kinase